MQLSERAIGDVTVLDIEGNLLGDDGAEHLRDKVASLVFQGRSQLLLNLSAVPYMDSAGLGELVRCFMVARRAGGTVKLVNLTTRITDLLAITKLVTIFDTFDAEPEALASFGG